MVFAMTLRQQAETSIIGSVGDGVKPAAAICFGIIAFFVSNLRLEISPNR
jgi:hypothetical protein